jgi:arginyl-tRNA synthetase
MKINLADKCKHISYGMVRFPWGKMSSRSGDNVLYSDFKNELVNYSMKEVEKRFKDLESTEVYDRALAISIASLKYSMLKQDTNKNLVFDPKKSLSFEGDTGPYLLYSYARALSILKKAEYHQRRKFEIEKISDSEKKLIVELGNFPEIVKSASKTLSPNLIANYSFQLAKTFSEFYHNCQVIGSEEEKFRLKLVDCFSQTIKNSLHLLGIPVIPEM